MSRKLVEPIHYCSTCIHSKTPMSQAPCSDCVPGNFGGPDRWVSREEVEEIRAEQIIAERMDNGL